MSPRPHTVLVCDDDALMRHEVAGYLRADPRLELVGKAEDVRQALDLAGRLRPAVALVYLRMPRREDGFEVLRRLPGVSPETRTLVLSAHYDERDIVEVLGAGARGIIRTDHLIFRRDRPTTLDAICALAEDRRFHNPHAHLLLHRQLCPLGAEAPTLNGRLIEVLQLIEEGLTDEEIATRLSLSCDTVADHVSDIYAALGAECRQDVVWIGIDRGIITPSDPIEAQTAAAHLAARRGQGLSWLRNTFPNTFGEDAVGPR